jgi:hypothetical protein
VTYLYETHLHTAGVSACAVSRGSDYIKGYRDLGYSGVIVTDHFYNGNTSLEKNLPWREWVNRFASGFEEAWEEGQRCGLDVFFGWEETFDAFDDYLVYGLDKNWLLEHPQMRNWTRAEQYRAVKASGGCVVQAHPFRQHHYISRLILSLGCADAVEAANGGNDDKSYDALAYRYAKRAGKPVTAGTDIHIASTLLGGGLFGVYLDKKMNTIADYVDAIRHNTIAGIRTSPSRCEYCGYEDVMLPVDIRDENDRTISRNWKDFC